MILRSLFMFMYLIIGAQVDTISTLNSKTYKAGVVEYHPFSGSLLETIEKNLNNYLEIIVDAGKENVDILVFPEATLNRYGIYGNRDINAAIEIPSKEEQVIPCEEEGKYNKILEQISCAAAKEKMYIVINVGEKAYCPKESNNKCKEGEEIYFNTNVVFDRKGTIISKYRKINLYGEEGFSESLDNSYETFNTDFNVTFGHFICFDLLFQQPAAQIIEKGNVSNVIFTTMWFSELPSLTAVEIQESYAYKHNINFLAAGANNPFVGSTGSGIYSGKRGALNATMNSLNKTMLLTYELSKFPIYDSSVREISGNKHFTSDMDGLFLTTNNMKEYEHEDIDLSKDHQTITLNYGNSSCYFDIKTLNRNTSETDTNSQYKYKAIMFDGVRSFRFKNGGVFECLIIACTSDEFKSCGKRFVYSSEEISNTVSIMIEITASVTAPFVNMSTQASSAIYSPVTLTTSIMPFITNSYGFETIPMKEDDKLVIKMRTKLFETDFLTFGIFGRVYSNDYLPVTGGISGLQNSFINTSVFIILAFLSNISFF